MTTEKFIQGVYCLFVSLMSEEGQRDRKKSKEKISFHPSYDPTRQETNSKRMWITVDTSPATEQTEHVVALKAWPHLQTKYQHISTKYAK